MMTRPETSIAIIGPGAIGGIVATRLANTDGLSVVLCGRSPVGKITVCSDEGELSAELEELRLGGDARPVDWIVVATKVYQSAAAAKWFPQLLGSDTKVAILQNGAEHLANFKEFIAEDRIVPVMVDIPAERLEGSRILQRNRGQLVMPSTEAGKAFAALFSDTSIVIDLKADMTTVLWRKLCTNAAGAVSALTLIPAKVSRLPEGELLMRALVRECIAVGRAEGAVFGDGWEDEVISGCQNADPESVNSLHADCLNGRPMEWDARNGVIARLGRVHGIETPYNEMAAMILKLKDC